MSLKVKSPATPAMMKNTTAAPVVFFDNAPVFGAFCGNIEVELTARILSPRADGQSILTEALCTAHLRCSPSAAIALIDALTKSLDMHAKQQGAPSDHLSN